MGSPLIKTTHDLSLLLQKGQMVRLMDKILVVVQIEENALIVDRNWVDAHVHGQVLYLLPSFKGQPNRRYYKAIHRLNSLLVDNSLYQNYLKGYAWLLQSWLTQAVERALMAKALGSIKTYKRLMKKAKKYGLKLAHVQARETRDVDLVDLGEQLSPEEEARLKAEKKLKKKMEWEAEQELQRQEQEQIRTQKRMQKDMENMKRKKENQENQTLQDGEQRVSQKLLLKLENKADDDLSTLGDDDSAEVDEDEEEDVFAKATISSPKTKKLRSKRTKMKKAKKIELVGDLGSITEGDENIDNSGSEEEEEEEEGDDDEIESVASYHSQPSSNPSAVRKSRPWIANKDELFERTSHERTLTRHELAKLAEDWRDFVDPLTELMFYVNQKTNEKSLVMPKCWSVSVSLPYDSLPSVSLPSDSLPSVSLTRLFTLPRTNFRTVLKVR